MTAYWFVIFLMVFIQLIPHRSLQGAKVKLFVSLLVLFVYGSIRVDFGLDYRAYEDAFYLTKMGWSSNQSEIGYELLNKIMPTHRLLLMTLTAFTCYTYFRFIYKVIPDKYYWLAFLIMGLLGSSLIFFQFSGLRNAISVNILCLSFPLIRDRKLLPFILTTAIAVCFHTSSIIFMPVAYLLCSSKLSYKYLFGVIIVILYLLIFTSDGIVSYVENIINIYMPRYSAYTENLVEATDLNITTYIYICAMLFILMYILFTERLSKNAIVVIKLSIIFSSVALLGAFNFRAAQWFAVYYMALPILITTEARNMIIKIAFWLVFLFGTIYSLINYIYNNPYFTYFEFKTIFS